MSRNISPDAALLRRVKALLGLSDQEAGDLIGATRESTSAYLTGRARLYLSEEERENLATSLKARREAIAALEMEI